MLHFDVDLVVHTMQQRENQWETHTDTHVPKPNISCSPTGARRGRERAEQWTSHTSHRREWSCSTCFLPTPNIKRQSCLVASFFKKNYIKSLEWLKRNSEFLNEVTGKESKVSCIQRAGGNPGDTNMEEESNDEGSPNRLIRKYTDWYFMFKWRREANKLETGSSPNVIII